MLSCKKWRQIWRERPPLARVWDVAVDFCQIFKVRINWMSNKPEEVEQLKEKYDKVCQELEASKAKSLENQKERDEVKSELHDVREELERTQSQMDEILGELEQTHFELHQLKEKGEVKQVESGGELEKELEEAKAKLEENKSDLGNVREELERAQAQLDEVLGELEQTHFELHQLKEKGEQSQLESEVKKELEETKAKLLETEELLEKSQSQLGETMEVLEEYKSQMEQTMGVLEESQGKLQQKQEELDRVKAELGQRQLSSESEVKKELEETKGKLRETEELLEKSQSQLGETMEVLEEYQSKMEEMMGVLEEYQSQLKQKEEVPEQLKSQLCSREMPRVLPHRRAGEAPMGLKHRKTRLNKLGSINQSSRYLEIGVNEGKTFNAIEIEHKVAVDLKFQFNQEKYATDKVIFLEVSSDEFFKNYAQDFMPFDLIYLDGLHTFEQTFRDFCASIYCAHSQTIWLIDDTCPGSYAQAQASHQRCRKLKEISKEKNKSWMGDVYKVIAAINDFFPQFSFATFPDRGQTVVWKNWRTDFKPQWNSLERISRLEYLDFAELQNTLFQRTPYNDIFEAIGKNLNQ